ncbi:MAG: aldehyde dehydrogenase family protein, partial [Planctomycetota bacterium]
NPWDGKTVATVSLAGRRRIQQALRASKRASVVLRQLSRARRAEILERITSGLADARTEIVDALIMESGKPRMFAEQELDRTLSVFAWAAGEARRFDGERIPLDGMRRGEGYEGWTRREPIGPVLGITPFNFPLNLVAHKIAPALAVGCPVIIKPSSDTPITALILGRVISEAGAPPGAVNVLPMRHADIPLLLASSVIRLVSFTGSPAVGWRIKKQVERQPVMLELGGNSGTIVDADADIAEAARRCAVGGFAQAGQSCISVQRIYAHERIYEAFLDALVHETKQLKAGDPRRDDVTVGPVIHGRAADRVMAWIGEAVAAGARILAGGHRLGDGAGNLIEPTILVDVTEDMGVCRKEIFGPVVTVAPFAELEDAIGRINRSEFGLQAAIFSQRLDHVQQAVETLDVGGVVINDVPTFRVDHMPYGGVKGSGLGREGLRSAMREMSVEKMVVVKRA